MVYDYDRTITRYSYDRVAVDSATPTFDKLFKDADKIDSILVTVSKKLDMLAGKVEKAASSYVVKPEAYDILGKMMDAARLVFDPFRPLLSKGASELDEIKDAHFDAARQARELYNAVKSDLDKAYNAVAQVRQDKDQDDVSGLKKAAHDLAMAVSTLKTLFGQYVRAYSH